MDHQGDNMSPMVDISITPWNYADAGFRFQGLATSKFFNMDSNEHIARPYNKPEKLRDIGRNIYPAVFGSAIEKLGSIIGFIVNRPAGTGYIYDDMQWFLTRNTRADDDKGLPESLIDPRRSNIRIFLLHEVNGRYLEAFRKSSDYFNNPVSLIDDSGKSEGPILDTGVLEEEIISQFSMLKEE